MIQRNEGAVARLAAGFLLAALPATLFACAGTRPAPSPGPPWAPSAPVARAPMLPADPDAGADPKRFTGSNACFDCHMDRVKSLKSSFHAPLLEKRHGSIGCEECHGPAIDHVADGDERAIRDPKKAPREGMNAVCLRCHAAVLETPVRDHPKWIGTREVACVQCHRVHAGTEVRVAAHGRGEAADVAALLAQGATYPEPARCISCHRDYHPEMARSGHADLVREGQACGSCHGPGSLHAESGGLRGLILLPTRQEAAAADATCNACHEAGNRPLLRWACSEHRAEGVSCVACHDPNAARGKTLWKEDPKLCLKCHEDAGAEFRLPSHHRVREGTMKCADCHDPHGNEAGTHRFELTRDACVRCHPEKGGPFVFDHAAKTLDGCVACHRPHGSPNPRLLETREVRTLCLSCHPDMPPSHAQGTGSPYRECLRCHVEIHGSNVDPRLHR